nr:MAG TPA: hypothetical protein [Caudoviricetes sp.]
MDTVSPPDRYYYTQTKCIVNTMLIKIFRENVLTKHMKGGIVYSQYKTQQQNVAITRGDRNVRKRKAGS